MSNFHFGINISRNKIPKISRETYATIDKRSSFYNDRLWKNSTIFDEEYDNWKYEDKDHKIYSDQWCEQHQKDALKNYDINMHHCQQLNKEDFNKEIEKLKKSFPEFVEVDDLDEYDNLSGIYILILDEYKQMYIGQTSNIRQRIMHHWGSRKRFDRLIFGSIETSKISIDSFGPLDTTRILIMKLNIGELFDREEEIVKTINNKYLLNRVEGGLGDTDDFSAIDLVSNIKSR